MYKYLNNQSMSGEPSNKKCQDYVYVKWDYQSTMLKMKHYFRHENKINENKAFSYCEAQS